MSPMAFGILSFAAVPYEELARRFRQAEELGFASAWLDDDVLTRYADFEPWTALAALARDTARIRLGTMVTSVTFRHPSFLAAQVATLDHLSGGRAELGLGAGGPPNPYGAFGLDDWGPRERAERLEEQAAILDPLLQGEAVDFEGHHYRAIGARLPRPPVRRPRPSLIVAAHGDRGLRVAARHADGWNSFGGQPYPGGEDWGQGIPLTEAVAYTRRLSERLDGVCREEGRDPTTLRRTVLAYRPVPDPLTSRDAFDEYAGTYREIGIEEVVFYWPPLRNVIEGLPISAQQQAAFERIAADRIRAGRAAS
jgi:alkanesulfonate monooxygenase SsuD/methylene tetrahydromethanopterin reductase-like flavin-dependent oxidoreductase (luciferase family)